MIRTLLFDLDNTLIDRDAAFRAYARDFCRRSLSQYSAADRRAARREMIARDARGYCRREEFCAWVAARFPEAGLTPDAVWNDHCRHLIRHVRPDPHVAALLDRLDARLRWGIVTNGSARNQRAKLRRGGLERRTAFVTISEDVGLDKPQPGIFQAALADLDCPPEQALMVGDDPVCDIAGASRAGLATCWVAHGRRFPDGLPRPDHIIGHVAELEAVLR